MYHVLKKRLDRTRGLCKNIVIIQYEAQIFAFSALAE